MFIDCRCHIVIFFFLQQFLTFILSHTPITPYRHIKEYMLRYFFYLILLLLLFLLLYAIIFRCSPFNSRISLIKNIFPTSIHSCYSNIGILFFRLRVIIDLHFGILVLLQVRIVSYKKFNIKACNLFIVIFF